MEFPLQALEAKLVEWLVLARNLEVWDCLKIACWPRMIMTPISHSL